MNRAIVALALVIAGVLSATVSAFTLWGSAGAGLTAAIGLFLVGILLGLGD